MYTTDLYIYVYMYGCIKTSSCRHHCRSWNTGGLGPFPRSVTYAKANCKWLPTICWTILLTNFVFIAVASQTATDRCFELLLVIGIDIIRYSLLFGSRVLWYITIALWLSHAFSWLVLAFEIIVTIFFIQKLQRISAVVASVHSRGSSWILRLDPPHSHLFPGLPASTNLP